MCKLWGYKMLLAEVFADDSQGRRFADVANDPRLNFSDILGFFDDPGRQQRMIDSELHHDRPPLAGVIRELEARDDVHDGSRPEGRLDGTPGARGGSGRDAASTAPNGR